MSSMRRSRCPAWQVKPGGYRIEGDVRHPILFLPRSSFPIKIGLVEPGGNPSTVRSDAVSVCALRPLATHAPDHPREALDGVSPP
jgi:hypothetical protein